MRCWPRRTTSTSSSTTPIAPDPEGIITSGHDNQTGRTVAVRQNETINTRALGESVPHRSSPTTAPADGARSSRKADEHRRWPGDRAVRSLRRSGSSMRASLSDANKALRILPRELRPYSRGIRMVGRAVTVRPHGLTWVPVLAGLQQCGAGDILVVDAGTTDHAVLGELFATEALRRADGRHRRLRAVPRHRRSRPACRCRSTPSARFPRAAGATRLPASQQPVRLGDIGGPAWRDPGRRRRRHRGARATRSWKQRSRPPRRSSDAKAGSGRPSKTAASLFEQLNFAEHVADLQAGRPSSRLPSPWTEGAPFQAARWAAAGAQADAPHGFEARQSNSTRSMPGYRPTPLTELPELASRARRAGAVLRQGRVPPSRVAGLQDPRVRPGRSIAHSAGAVASTRRPQASPSCGSDPRRSPLVDRDGRQPRSRSSP